MPFGLTGLWGNANFMKLWTAQTISVFGSTISREALPLVAILTLASSPAQVGLLTALSAIPTLVLGLPAGVWVDRLRRRPILIIADVGRALILVSIPLAAWWGVLSLPQLYLVALLAGTLTLFFRVADNSFLPTVVSRKELVEANSKFGLTDSAAEIAAPAITGSLVQAISAPLTILIDAVSYLFSALLIGLVRAEESPPQAHGQPQNLRREIITGLKLVAHSRVLRAVAATSAMFTFFGGFFGALYGLYVLRVVGLTPAVLGLLVSTGGIGALLGALLAGKLLRRFGLGPTLIGAFLIMGLTTFLVPLAAGRALAVVMLTVGQLVGDTALTVYLINEVSLRQAVTPNHVLGRMNASFEFLVTGLSPLGLLLGGFLGELLGIRPALFIAAVGISVGGLGLIFSPVGRLRDYPETEMENEEGSKPEDIFSP